MRWTTNCLCPASVLVHSIRVYTSTISARPWQTGALVKVYQVVRGIRVVHRSTRPDLVIGSKQTNEPTPHHPRPITHSPQDRGRQQIPQIRGTLVDFRAKLPGPIPRSLDDFAPASVMTAQPLVLAKCAAVCGLLRSCDWLFFIMLRR